MCNARRDNMNFTNVLINRVKKKKRENTTKDMRKF